MEKFKFRTEGRIGYLTMNRPDKYTFDLQMVDEFGVFLRERMYDESVGAIILTEETQKASVLP